MNQSYVLRSLLCLAVWLLAELLPAQSCGTGSSLTSPALIRRGESYSAWSTNRSGITFIKLKVRIASLPGPGGDATSLATFQGALDRANTAFLPGNIQFVLCGEPEIVDDMDYYYMQDPVTKMTQYHTDGMLNISVVYWNPISDGFASYDHVVLDFNTLYNGNALAHELGHTLGLLHTHEFPGELVNGSNCTTTGDYLCDTPADPNLGLPGMMSMSGCTYIGTGTDANGQPYAPLTNNIMSYATWGCLQSFTNDQFNVMHLVLDSTKFYLRRADAPVLITQIPDHFCTYSPPVTLSATPAGGTFSGTQVSGNTLYPSGAPGVYSVHYTPATPPQETHIDQSAYYAIDADTLTDAWQSFTTYDPGTITAVDFFLQTLTATNFTFNLYQGTGTGGTLIWSGTFTQPAMPSPDWVQVPVGISYAPATGTICTAELISNTGVSYTISGYNTGNFFDDYRGGISNDANYDLRFREWVNGISSCPEAHRYYSISIPPNGHLLNLAARYCTSDDSVPLKGDLPISNFVIDGNAAPLLIPASLSPGTHQVLYLSTTNGCVDTTAYTTEIDDPNATFQNVVDPVCTSYPAYTLLVDHPGGTISIDSTASATFDPAALGVGSHIITYTNNDLLDTTRFIEQECSAFPYQALLLSRPVDSVMWQSFRAAQSGVMTKIEVELQNQHNPIRWETKLLKGDGPAGPVILQDTITLPIVGWSWTPIFDSTSTAWVDDDSMYTFTMRRLPDVFTNDSMIVGGRMGTIYTAGRSNADRNDFTAKDFAFKEYLTQYTGCAISVSDTVDVTVCTSVENSSSGNTMQVWPSPAGTTLLVKSDATDIGQAQLSLYDLSGRMVMEHSCAGNHLNEQLDVSALPPGLYLLVCRTEKNVITQRIEIAH